MEHFWDAANTVTSVFALVIAGLSYYHSSRQTKPKLKATLSLAFQDNFNGEGKPVDRRNFLILQAINIGQVPITITNVDFTCMGYTFVILHSAPLKYSPQRPEVTLSYGQTFSFTVPVDRLLPSMTEAFFPLIDASSRLTRAHRIKKIAVQCHTTTAGIVLAQNTKLLKNYLLKLYAEHKKHLNP